MNTTTSKMRLALLTNMIAPYRLPIYTVLADRFDLLVLHGGTESNRSMWGNLEETLPTAKITRAWGWQISRKKKLNGKVFDDQFIHITPGFLWHLLRFRPAAVITSEMGFRTALALAYGFVFGKPVWIWWEGTLHSERNIGLLRKLFRKAIRACADRWITCGQTSTEYLLDLGVQRDMILELQNSVDERRFQGDVAPAWQIEPRPVVLCVGRLVELKGVRSLLDAASILQRNGFEFSLLLVGDGPEKQALQERVQTLGLKNVHFQPAQPPDSMPSIYRSADLVVFPTLQDVWGFIANEAILSGIPVLCSKYAGCAPDLFAPEHIFAPEDLQEFSEKLGAAVSGRLSKADPDRLKTTEQLGAELVNELNSFLPTDVPHHQRSSQSASR